MVFASKHPFSSGISQLATFDDAKGFLSAFDLEIFPWSSWGCIGLAVGIAERGLRTGFIQYWCTDRLIRWYTDILIYWYTDTLTSCFTTVVVAIYIYIFICIHIYDLHGLVDLLYTQVFSGMINRKLVYTTIYRYGYIIYIYTHIHTNLIFRFAMIPHDIRNITMSCMDPSTFWGSIWGI